MALSVTFNFHGVPLPNCYVRVTSVHAARNGNHHIAYSVFATEQQKLMDEPVERGHAGFPYTTATGDIYVWAYNKLKALPEFAGAVDA